jgi:hypothetical protein
MSTVVHCILTQAAERPLRKSRRRGMSRSNAGYEKKATNERTKKIPRAVREIPFLVERAGRCRLVLCGKSLPVFVHLVRKDRQTASRCSFAMSHFRRPSILDFRSSSTRIVIHHLLNMPSSQPRSPPVVVPPLPKLPISGNKGAGLWSSLVCSMLFLDAGLS